MPCPGPVPVPIPDMHRDRAAAEPLLGLGLHRTMDLAIRTVRVPGQSGRPIKRKPQPDNQSVFFAEYRGEESSAASAAATAEILQSLSRAKVFSGECAPAPAPARRGLPRRYRASGPGDPETVRLHGRPALPPDPRLTPARLPRQSPHSRPPDDRRTSFGECVGKDFQPPESDEAFARRYAILRRVMLDHTYAVSPRSVDSPAEPPPEAPAATSTPPPVAVAAAPTMPSPKKGESPPTPVPVRSPLSLPFPLPLRTDGARKPAGSPFVEEEDEVASVGSSPDETEEGRDRDGDGRGSDTETAPETEEDGKTRCVCEFTHDDGYMICCDRCGEWQHVDCMAIDRQNIPDDYMCERCQPRLVDRKRARSIQMRKREELSGVLSSASDSSSGASSDRKGKRSVVSRGKTFATYGRTVVPGGRVAPARSAGRPPPAANSPGERPAKRPKRVDGGKRGSKKKASEKKSKRKTAESKAPRAKGAATPGVNATTAEDPYELATTNHYSPELRAKIVRYHSNGPDSGVSSAGILTARNCATVPHAGDEILIATEDLKENSPIVELRGKYMLSDQHRPQPQSPGRTGGRRPGPRVFFYRLGKEARVCIDTRTYGNEARFVRRSCKPNAELRHCVVKGTLHVYLASVSAVQANTEITIKHDDGGNPQPCACGNPKFCKRVSDGSSVPPDKEEHPHDKKGRTRLSSSTLAHSNAGLSPAKDVPFKESFGPKLERLMNDRESMSEAIDRDLDEIYSSMKEESPERNAEDSNVAGQISDDISPETIKVEFDARIAVDEGNVKSEHPMEDDENASAVRNDKNLVREPMDLKCDEIMDCPRVKERNAKDPQKNREVEKPKIPPPRRPSVNSARTTRSSMVHNLDSIDEKTDSSGEYKSQSTKEKKAMTREERKLEAIMKAIERMEKAEQRKLENRDKQTKRRESDSRDKDDDGEIKLNKKKKSRTQSLGQSNRNRINSMDSDAALTSGDENSSLLLSPTRESKKGSDPQVFSPIHDSNSLDHNIEKMNVSSACLLVEAAVGPLETTFKLPKTKKTIMNEWLNKSPDISSSYDNFNQTDNTATADNNNSSHHFVDKESFVGPKSIENLVKVANTMIGNMSGGAITVDSTPEKNYDSGMSESEGSPTSAQISYTSRVTRKILKDSVAPEKPKSLKKNRKVTRNNVEDRFTTKRPLRSSTNRDASPIKESVSESVPNDTECTNILRPLQHSAKKRWLRQAISEESDSPTAESPPNEMLTPLKKRRLARESLSIEIKSLAQDSLQTNRLDSIKELPVSAEQLPVPCESSEKESTSNTPKEIEIQINACVPCNVKLDSEVDVSTESKHLQICSNTLRSETPEKILDHSPMKSITPPLHSTETSGNSSPVLDEMDDIQKKIHSFHTENILILKSRNKKPKDKRKKVNLNFDLCVLDDQTVSVKLKSEDDSPNITADDKTIAQINKSPVDVENGILTNNFEENVLTQDKSDCIDTPEKVKQSEFSEPIVNNNSTFLRSPLFMDNFRSESQVKSDTSLVPDLDAIKNAIDKTASLDTTMFLDKHLNSMDEYRNVQEILLRVNQMDSKNSVLLSGVLKDANHANNPDNVKNFSGRQADPRLNHPPPEKPKPIKRKLSIYEYRRRQSMASVSSLDASDNNITSDVSQSGQDSTSDTHRSPSPARDELSSIEKDLNDSVAELSKFPAIDGHATKLIVSKFMEQASNRPSTHLLFTNPSQMNIDR